MQPVFAPHPSLEREQSKNQQSRRANPKIGQRGKCQGTHNCVCDQCPRQATHKSCRANLQLKYWCTGKDSNLRTSLGGTDLQSVGFNHSPTCAKLPGEAAAAHHPPSDQATHTNSCRRLPDFANQFSQNRFRKSGKPKIALLDYRAKVTTSRIKFRMECVGKTCCAAAYEPAACRNPIPKNSLPDFCILELAKGFEPPTP
jgi:hypothetical protein